MCWVHVHLGHTSREVLETYIAQRGTVCDQPVILEVTMHTGGVHGDAVGQRGEAESQVIRPECECEKLSVKGNRVVEEARSVQHSADAGGQKEHLVHVRGGFIPLCVECRSY